MTVDTQFCQSKSQHPGKEGAIGSLLLKHYPFSETLDYVYFPSVSCTGYAFLMETKQMRSYRENKLMVSRGGRWVKKVKQMSKIKKYKLPVIKCVTGCNVWHGEYSQ